MLQLQCGKTVSEHYYTAQSIFDTNVEDHDVPLMVNCCGRVAGILPFTTDVSMGRQDYYLIYDKLENINRAIGSKNLNEVTDIYSSDIGWLVSGNGKKVHSDIQNVLDKIKALIR